MNNLPFAESSQNQAASEGVCDAAGQEKAIIISIVENRAREICISRSDSTTVSYYHLQKGSED